MWRSSGGVQPGQRQRQARQRGGRAAAADAVDEQVAVGQRPAHRVLGLGVGVVGQRQRHEARWPPACPRPPDATSISASRSTSPGSGSGHGRRGRGPAGAGERLADGGDQHRQVGVALAVGRRRPATGRRRPGRSGGSSAGRGCGPVDERRHVDGRQRRLVPRAGRQRRLDGDHLAGPQPHVGPARRGPGDGGRVGHVDDVAASRWRPAPAGRCAGWCWPGCCR